jgi:hypothetical protein
MPILALIYVLLISALAIDELSDMVSGQSRPQEPAWYTAVGLASTAIMLLMFMGYWMNGLVRSMGVLAAVLLVLSLMWEVCTARHRVERAVREAGQGESPAVRALTKRLSIAVVVILNAIGYLYGGVAVLRGI